MRDRLLEVYITDDFSSFLDKSTSELAITKFQQLYDNLNQFNNLIIINITRKTDNGVQALEHIVETCRSLRNIKISISSSNNQHDPVQLKNDIDLDTTSHYIPRYNINTLTISLPTTPIDYCKLLLYIIKKFPNLEKLDLTDTGKDVQVTPYVLTQLLNYLHTIEEFSLRSLTLNEVDLYKIIGNFWNTTTKSEVVLKLLFLRHIEKPILRISKDFYKRTTIVLFCPVQSLYRQTHLDFIEKIGKFIDDLTIIGDDYKSVGPENYLNHIFKHCPNLQDLHLEDFQIGECVHSFEEINKHSIDEFDLIRCELDLGTLERLSMVLSEVNQLHLYGTHCFNSEDYYIYRINMPQTKIRRIILGLMSDKYPTYVKLFVVNDQKYYYYQSGTDSGGSWKLYPIVKQVDEKAYNEANENICYKHHICSQTKPEIIFEFDTYKYLGY